jgi:CBS-domain-containing membrane protein
MTQQLMESVLFVCAVALASLTAYNLIAGNLVACLVSTTVLVCVLFMIRSVNEDE